MLQSTQRKWIKMPTDDKLPYATVDQLPVIWRNGEARLLAGRGYTVWLSEADGERDVEFVFHARGKCHICAIGFHAIAESRIAGWCVECYDRYLNRGGKMAITNWAREARRRE